MPVRCQARGGWPQSTPAAASTTRTCRRTSTVNARTSPSSAGFANANHVGAVSALGVQLWRQRNLRGILKSSSQGAAMRRRDKRGGWLALGWHLLALERALVTDRNDHLSSLGGVLPGDGLPEQYVYYCPMQDCASNLTRTRHKNTPDRAARQCDHPPGNRILFRFKKDEISIDIDCQQTGAGYYLYICPSRLCEGPAERRAQAVNNPRCTCEDHGDGIHRIMACAVSA
ncbi:hypothetical protein QF026_002409 [Streptomyces aurantiacus]|nr:hypothetical protein [Streptomyces aurantiacus]